MFEPRRPRSQTPPTGLALRAQAKARAPARVPGGGAETETQTQRVVAALDASEHAMAGSIWCTGPMCMIVLGALLSQISWWMLYSDTGLCGGIIGSTLVLAGGVWLRRFVRRGKTRPRRDKSFTDNDHQFVACVLLFLVLAAVTSTTTAALCPARDTVPVTFVGTDGYVDTEWVDRESAEAVHTNLMRTSAPNCTNTCTAMTCTDDEYEYTCESHVNNRVCDDGGLHSGFGFNPLRLASRNSCPLGSDTTDCGCPHGRTAAEWLSPQNVQREFGWFDRAGVCLIWATPSILCIGALSYLIWATWVLSRLHDIHEHRRVRSAVQTARGEIVDGAGGEIVDDAPPPPPVWVERVDMALYKGDAKGRRRRNPMYGRVYYYNIVTKESCWTKPFEMMADKS